MQNHSSVRLALTLAPLAAFSLALTGCGSSSFDESIPTPTTTAASTGFSPGIGGPGGSSPDTRGAGTVTPGEGAGLSTGNGLGSSPSNTPAVPANAGGY